MRWRRTGLPSRMPVDEVVETIKSYGGNQLSAEAVRIFLATVPPYPVCSQVVVNGGMYAGYQRGGDESASEHGEAGGAGALRLQGGTVEPFELHLESDSELKVSSGEDRRPDGAFAG